ncbi:MAG: DUF4115 domain-containing protein [Meiothermus sp.]
MCELGQRLKEAREAKGLELAAAAAALKVRRVTLQALEDCRFEELPEPALARGYLRHYAQLLGLDPAPLLMMYPTKVASSPTVTYLSPQPAAAVPQPRRSNPWVWILPLLLLLGVGGWFGWRTLSPTPTPVVVQPAPVPTAPKQVTLKISTKPGAARVYLDGFLLGQAPVETRVEAGERTLRVEAQGYQAYQQVVTLQENRNLLVSLQPAKPNPTPSQPGANNPSATPANPTTPANPSTTPTQAQTPSTGLVLRFEGNSWVRVTTPGGTQLFQGVPAKGSQQTYPLPVVVRVGNAQAVRVILNGQDQGLLGGDGEVVSRRFGQ